MSYATDAGDLLAFAILAWAFVWCLFNVTGEFTGGRGPIDPTPRQVGLTLAAIAWSLFA